jgi:hypothetical protein
MYHLDGTVACQSDVESGALYRDRFANIEVPCRLQSDGPATVAVLTLGRADVAVERLNLNWHH